MSHIDPSAAPRYRLAPSDSERLREILADVPPKTGAYQGGSCADRERRRRRWLWALLAAGFLLAVVVLALATVSPPVEDVARGVLSTLGADPDAVLAGVSRLLPALRWREGVSHSDGDAATIEDSVGDCERRSRLFADRDPGAPIADQLSHREKIKPAHYARSRSRRYGPKKKNRAISEERLRKRTHSICCRGFRRTTAGFGNVAQQDLILISSCGSKPTVTRRKVL